jgi:Uma2 family endonuclease
MSTKIEPLLTVEDLDAMPDDGNRYEIIERELIVTCSPDAVHQGIVRNLTIGIGNFLLKNPVGQIWPGLGAILSEHDAVIPDLIFISNNRLNEIMIGKGIKGAPDLAIEIVSPGADNSRRDRIAKRQLYGKFLVSEYWIVDPAQRNIEVYLLEGQSLKLHVVYGPQDQLISSVLPGFSCGIEEIFAA